MNSEAKIACTILTGFLGSGKTTLLNQLLTTKEMANAAVLVNELGIISLDHDLIVHSEDSLIVLAGGCVCCALREDVETAIRLLIKKRDSGEIPAFEHLIIETTGLADPIPLLMTLRSFGLARERMRPAKVITTADAALLEQTTAGYKEAARQLVAANLVIITKSDTVSEGDTIEAIKIANKVNPWCEAYAGSTVADNASRVLSYLDGERENADSKAITLNDVLLSPKDKVEHGNIVTLPLSLDMEVDWTAFGIWMTLLLHRHGGKVLRVKGILNVQGTNGPVVVHSAQHMVYPPVHLEQWPSSDRTSRLVFILDGLDPALVLRSIEVFLRAASTPYGRLKVESHSAPAGAGGTIGGRPVRRPTAPRWIRG